MSGGPDGTGGSAREAGAAGEEPDVPVDGPQTVSEARLLARLGPQARAVNLRRVVRLGQLLDVAAAGALDEAGRVEAENLAHQVVGSAGTFGFPTASVDASAVEDFFAAAAGACRPSADEVGALRGTLGRLRAEFAG